MRTADQIRVSVCYNNLHVIIGGAHAGISTGPDGATHQALEDIAVMRSLPGITVLSPCDENQTKAATIAALTKNNGPCYIRYGREPVPNFTSTNQQIEIGKAQVVKEGTDLSIIATGSMVWQALEVAKEISKLGINAELINIHTIKPIDEETIVNSAKKNGKVVTIEEHQIFGGLGSAVAEVLSQKYPVKMKIIGMPDCFGESGTPNELLAKYGLDVSSLTSKIITFLNE
jgi:transketolase